MAAEVKYDMTVHPTSALVRSQSDGASAHAVTLPSCDCADFINRRGRLVSVDGGIAVTLCKHIEAALVRIGGWNRPAPAPEVFADLTDVAVKEMLRSKDIGFTPRASNSLVAAAVGENPRPVPFAASLTGALVDGTLAYDRRTSRYALTVIR